MATFQTSCYSLGSVVVVYARLFFCVGKISMGTIEPSEKKLTNKKHDEQKKKGKRQNMAPLNPKNQWTFQKRVAWTYIEFFWISSLH